MDIITLLILLIVLIIVILLRKEIPRIVTWLISFRKITKDEKGFSLVGFSETNIESNSKSNEIKELNAQTESGFEKEVNQTNDYFLLYIEKKYDEALIEINNLIDKTDDEVELIRYKSIKGLILFSIDRDRAIRHFQEIIKLHPNNNTPFEWFAFTYYTNEIYDKSLEVIESGLTSTDNKSDLITWKAKCLIAIGESEKAKDTLIVAINDNNDIPRHFEMLCELLENEPDSAYSWFQKGVHKYNENVELIKNFGLFLEKHKKNDEVLFQYHKLINIEPDKPSTYGLLGNTYLSNGLPDKALEAYKKANELAKMKEGWIIANIGNIYNNQGFFTESIAYLKKSLEITPDSEYSHDRLAKALKSKAEEDKKESEILTEARKKNQFSQ